MGSPDHRFSAVPIDLLDSVCPKWRQVCFNYSIACWLTECRVSHSRVCRCTSFRNHWFQLEGRPVSTAEVGVQTDPGDLEPPPSGTSTAEIGPRVDAARRLLSSISFKRDACRALEGAPKPKRRKRGDARKEFLRRFREGEETESDADWDSFVEWSDSDGDPGVDCMRGGVGGGIIREDRMGGGIGVEGTGEGTGGTEGTPFLKLLSGNFTSSTPVRM